jgi:hypothetical protein
MPLVLSVGTDYDNRDTGMRRTSSSPRRKRFDGFALDCRESAASLSCELWSYGVDYDDDVG